MGTQRSRVLNMYDTDFGLVGSDVYANFKEQSLSKEADCKNIATGGAHTQSFTIQLLHLG
jgi:hypothetical protein